MSAAIIDGKTIAAALRAALGLEVAALKAKHRITPALAVVLVGDDPASQVYVKSKLKQTVEAGMRSIEHVLPNDIAEAELRSYIHRLNGDPEVDGILLQLPLPKHLSAESMLAEIDPAKDVDGLTDVNAGRLANGSAGLERGIVPCTPLGSMLLIRSVRSDLAGLEAVVIGRSNLFGKPMAQLLLQQDCTVTMAHSRTAGLAHVCQRADILIAAVGRPLMVKADWVKPGAIVIDVGINRIDAPNTTSGTRLVGDVDPSVSAVAGAMTPVPGGVGPMTIACLLRNTVQAAHMRRGLSTVR